MKKTVLLLAFIAITSSIVAGQTSTRRRGHVANHTASTGCSGASLSVRHVTEDAAMGGRNSIDYAFTNKSSSPCTLDGYPRFELLDKSGKVRRRAVGTEQLPGDDAKQPPQLVTIGPGKDAPFRVYYNSGGAGYTGRPCPIFRRVRITAPGSTRHFVLREHITLCADLQVSAVRSVLSQ